MLYRSGSSNPDRFESNNFGSFQVDFEWVEMRSIFIDFEEVFRALGFPLSGEEKYQEGAIVAHLSALCIKGLG